MGDKSAIEWTDATWNPIVGCSIVSPGCTNCYAMSMAARIDKMTLSSHYAGLTRKVNGKQVWTGKMAQAPQHILTAPLRWKKPRRIFVNSMGDLFHEDVPDEWIDQVFAVMMHSAKHTFQILTKRSKRMKQYIIALGENRSKWKTDNQRIPYSIDCITHGTDPVWPLPNVWIGVSCEDQDRADERIPDLLATPASVRFVSAEPLLAPIDFTNITAATPSGPEQWNALDRYEAADAEPGSPNAVIDWIIAGGESGAHARPMHPDWARSIRDQCATAGVPFFFKQWGEFAPCELHSPGSAPLSVITSSGRHLQKSSMLDEPSDAKAEMIRRFGKKRAGRLIDGIEHNGYPACHAPPP